MQLALAMHHKDQRFSQGLPFVSVGSSERRKLMPPHPEPSTTTRVLGHPSAVFLGASCSTNHRYRGVPLLVQV